jgi:hypothetical protein
MPSQDIHEQIDLILFGKAFPEVHRAKDAPIEMLGPFHRLLYHDPLYSLTNPHPAVSLMHDLVDHLTVPLIPLVYLIDPKMVL